MGEINKAGDDQSFDQVKLEMDVEATKLEKELVLMKVVTTADDNKKCQTESSGSSNRVEEVVKDSPDISERFMANVTRYIRSKPSERKAPYHLQSGFYNIPKDMLSPNASTRAEEIKLLYQPATGANFRNISNLLKNIDASNIERQSPELRHYYYHLSSYAKRFETRIEKLMEEAFSKGKEIAKSWYRPEDINNDDHEKASSSNNINERDFLRDSALLLASCFLIDMFVRFYLDELSVMEDPECAHLWVSELWADLLLLQNQIPFKFIDRIEPPLIYQYFCNFLPMKKLTHMEMRISPLHLLHLVHHMLLPRKSERPVRTLFVSTITRTLANIRRWLIKHQALQSLFVNRLMFSDSDDEESTTAPPTSLIKPAPTATRLQQAGVKFRQLYKAGFAVEFKSGVLNLPFLHITKCTKKVLLNLIAWEKTHREAPKYFINYAIFMDHLINTSRDVEILVQSGVFQHSLSTDEAVVALFNGLGENLVYTKDDRCDIFPQLSLDLNKYCQSRPNMWWANLMQDYFKSPWTIISLIAALFLILLTVAQTFFSAYSYFQPPKTK